MSGPGTPLVPDCWSDGPLQRKPRLQSSSCMWKCFYMSDARGGLEAEVWRRRFGGGGLEAEAWRRRFGGGGLEAHSDRCSELKARV